MRRFRRRPTQQADYGSHVAEPHRGVSQLAMVRTRPQAENPFRTRVEIACSGEGIRLLQLVVETVTHKPLDNVIEEKILQPFGMTRTSRVWPDRFASVDGRDTPIQRTDGTGLASRLGRNVLGTAGETPALP